MTLTSLQARKDIMKVKQIKLLHIKQKMLPFEFLQVSYGDIHGSIPGSGVFLTVAGLTAALAELIRAVFSFMVAESTVF
jgi:hypothetical protein